MVLLSTLASVSIGTTATAVGAAGSFKACSRLHSLAPTEQYSVCGGVLEAKTALSRDSVLSSRRPVQDEDSTTILLASSPACPKAVLLYIETF